MNTKKVLPDLESGLLNSPHGKGVRRNLATESETSQSSQMAFFEQSKPADAPKPKTYSFRVIANLVMAMRRFQAALNPTYEYGKRQPDPNLPTEPLAAVVARQQQRTLSGTPYARNGSARTGSARAQSGRTLSGRPRTPGWQHGFKTELLLRPLPEIPQEAR